MSENEIDSRATPEEREKILLKCGFKLDEDFELIVNSKYGYLVDNNDDEGISISSTDSLGEVFIPNQQISLIEDGMPVIAVATQTDLIEKTISNVVEVKSRGANVILVCTEACSQKLKEGRNDFFGYAGKMSEYDENLV